MPERMPTVFKHIHSAKCHRALNLQGSDADGFAIEVDKWPARVAEGDSGVPLQVLGHVAALQSQLAARAAIADEGKFRNGIGLALYHREVAKCSV